MHIPDGFINGATCLGAGAAATAGVSLAARRAGRALDDKRVPLAGLVAAFVFAAQMVNFPVGGGTSGHLIGAVLAAVLVGPWIGALCVAVVVIVQAFFADGGLTALGLNVLNIALIPSLAGYALFRMTRSVLPRSRAGVVGAAAVTAGLSVLMSAVVFVAEFSIGGSPDVELRAVAVGMLSVHSLIAVGEGVITGAAVGLVLNVRPDLVHGALGLDHIGLGRYPEMAREGSV